MKKFFMTMSLMIFCSIIVFSQQKTKINIMMMDDSFDATSKRKLDEASIILENVINSNDFAEHVLATNFKVGNFGLSNTSILELIKSGMDSIALKPKDYSIDIRVLLYDDYKGGLEFGRTDMKTHITETHRCFIVNNDVKCYVSHLAHEYLHQIGFYDERTWIFGKKTKSVPYKIGNIVNRIIDNGNICSAKPSTCKKN